MRIAPKPKAGAEITLSDLLSTPKAKTPDVESIIQTEDGWTLSQINTTEGSVRMEVSNLFGPKAKYADWRLPKQLEGQGYRLISVDEFYAMAKLLLDHRKDAVCQVAANSLREVLNKAWDDGPFLAYTLLKYTKDGQGSIIHRVGTRKESSSDILFQDRQWHEPELLAKVFGAANKSELTEAWCYVSGSLFFMYDRSIPTQKEDPVRLNFYLTRDGFKLHSPTFQKEGKTLFVKTTPIEARP